MSKQVDEFLDKHADYAMQQMERYGIPASVTLAQAMLETGFGKSELNKRTNNYFGVKGSYNGQYVTATDDRPDEKFKKYDSLEQSYEDHSKVLMAARYQKYVGKLSPDDYKGWANGIKSGGYASDPDYASKLINLIESNNLQKYDQMVLAKLEKEGKTIGVANHPLSAEKKETKSVYSGKSTGFNLPEGNYSFPMKCNEYLLVTSDYGPRHRPTAGASSNHKGLDFHAKSAELLATEDNGKVVKVNQDASNKAGKYVTVEYDRGGGAKTQLVYMHMSQVDVKVGDVVNAGDKLGVSGSTGVSTGEHLHFEVRQFDEPGKYHHVNPSAYLAEINAKGDLDKEVRDRKGVNLLKAYEPSVSDATVSQGKDSQDVKVDKDEQLTPQKWLTKLLAADGGILNGQNDGLLSTIFQLFLALMLMSKDFEKKSLSEKIEATTQMALEKRVDISSYTPALKSSSLVLADNGKIILSTNNGSQEFRHVLTDSEYARLNQALTSDLPDEQKRQRVSAIVYGITYTQQASINYDQIESQQRSQQESLKR